MERKKDCHMWISSDEAIDSTHYTAHVNSINCIVLYWAVAGIPQIEVQCMHSDRIWPRTAWALQSHTPGFFSLYGAITAKFDQRGMNERTTHFTSGSYKGIILFLSNLHFYFYFSPSNYSTSRLFLFRKRSLSIHPLLGIWPSFLLPSGCSTLHNTHSTNRSTHTAVTRRVVNK